MKKIIPTLLFMSLAALAFSQAGLEGKALFKPAEVARSEKNAWQQYQHAAASNESVASANFNVHYYRCEWAVDPGVRFISGKVTAHFSITSATNSISFDMHSALKVDSVIFRGANTVFQHSSDHGLIISLQQALAVNQKDSITICYQGVPPGNNSFSTSLQSGIPVMWTLSEPYGAKDWWPCRNGLDDKADSIDIVLTYPEIYHSSSNGLLVSKWNSNGRSTAYWKHRYPIASYLVAFAITNYVTYTETARIGNILLPVVMYAYPSHADYFRESTRIASRFLEIFSSLFGPYPFSRESYSQTQFNLGGGIEHQTNSFIGNNQNQLAVHELGHQWFGDQVTCESWEDIWLNEGFASYMQFLYVENIEPLRKWEHLNDNLKLITSEPGGSVKVNDTTNVNRIFDFRLTYAKGSFIVHMIRWKLGDSLFFKAIRQYLNDPLLSYGSARTADLKKNLEQVSGQDFTLFFKNWYEGEGYPSYRVEWTQNNNKWVNIRLNQTTSHRSVPFFEMPVPVQLKGAGRDTTIILKHSRIGEEFWIGPVFQVDSIIFDPELWLLSGNNTVTKTLSEINSNNITIYPNPVGDHFVVSVANPTGKKLVVQLWNTEGQLLYSKAFELNGRNEMISVPSSYLAKGLYLLRVQGEGFDAVKKMVR
ncbi:MAG: M1 family aminopeptidase [Chitinophagaceae bacterium]